MVQFTTGLAAAYPTALDKLNSDEAIEQMAEMYGTPPGLINSDERIEEIRTGRARQQMQSQQMGTLAQGMGMVGEAAKAAKDAGLSLENMDEDTVSQMAEAINPEQLKQMMGANNG
jgi:Bacteriophage head to tail connecting protein.